MKCVFLLLVGIVAVYGITPEQVALIKSQMLKVGEACQKETNTGADDIGLIMQKQSPTTAEGKCFLFCIHKNIGFQQTDGKLDPPSIKRWVAGLKEMDAELGDKMDMISSKCIEEVSDSGDACDTAVLAFQCYTKFCKENGVSMIM